MTAAMTRHLAPPELYSIYILPIFYISTYISAPDYHPNTNAHMPPHPQNFLDNSIVFLRLRNPFQSLGTQREKLFGSTRTRVDPSPYPPPT